MRLHDCLPLILGFTATLARTTESLAVAASTRRGDFCAQAAETAEPFVQQDWVLDARLAAIVLIMVLVWTSFDRLRSDVPFESDDPPFRIGATLEVLGVLILAISWYFGDVRAMVNGMGFAVTGRFLYFGQNLATLSSAAHAFIMTGWVFGFDDAPDALKFARTALPIAVFLLVYFHLSPRLGRIDRNQATSTTEDIGRTQGGQAWSANSTAFPRATGSTDVEPVDAARKQEATARAEQLIRALAEESGKRTPSRGWQPRPAHWLGAILLGILVTYVYDATAGFALTGATWIALLIRMVRSAAKGAD